MWIARDLLRALLLLLGIFESPVKICISKAGVRIVFGQSAVTPGAGGRFNHITGNSYKIKNPIGQSIVSD